VKFKAVPNENTDGVVKLRLDIWLDVACLFRTRSEAQRACKGGKVDVNGQRAKPHREIQIADEILMTRSLGRKQQVVVRKLVERHLPKGEAKQLYEDISPQPTPEEAEFLRLARLASPSARWGKPRAPEKRERRELRRLKGRTN
jgi:ribosome-associated heat shock protein Hsp15